MRPYYAGVLINLGRKLLQDVNQCRYEHHYNYLSIVLISFALYAVIFQALLLLLLLLY